MAERKTFLFFCGWAEVLADFKPEDRCAVYDAVIAYAENGTLPNLDPVLRMAFKFIKKDIDEMRSKYETICEKRREAINKRWAKRNAASQQGAHDSDGDTIVSSEYNRYKPIHSKHNHEHEHKHEHEFSDENIDKEKENDKRKSAVRFTPPTAEEVADFAQEKGYAIDADRFIAYYESNGWRVGKNPMKDWRAAVRSWVARDKAQNPVQGAQSLGVGEFINAKGIRTYGTGGQRVPQDAPARPSEAHYWSETTKRWEKQI